MKKILVMIFIAVFIVGLSSCTTTEENGDPLKKVLGDENINAEWFGTIEFEDEPIIDRVDTTSSCYTVTLPKDLTSAVRYTITNLEDSVYDAELFQSLSFTYLTLYEIDYDSVIEPILLIEDNIAEAFTDIEISISADSTTTISSDELDLDYEEGLNRSLIILYLPVLVNGYTSLSAGTNASHTLTTYSLIPIYYEINYSEGEDTSLELTSDNPLQQAYEIIRLDTSATIVNGLSE